MVPWSFPPLSVASLSMTFCTCSAKISFLSVAASRAEAKSFGVGALAVVTLPFGVGAAG
jgi:hypothetical protein